MAHFSANYLTEDVLTTEIGALDEQEHAKVERMIRRAVRRFSRMNREIDFGQVPPRARVELGERIAEFGSVVRRFNLLSDELYGDWLGDFDVATMNVDAMLQALRRDYSVVQIQLLTIPPEMRERKGGEKDV